MKFAVSTIEKEVIKIETEKVYILELNEEEALVLCLVLGCIMGNHRYRKEVTNPIFDELYKSLGITFDELSNHYIRGNLIFSE